MVAAAVAAKKRERGPRAEGESATLFLRGLPYDATSADLEALCSQVGPVKWCFVVADKGRLQPEDRRLKTEDPERRPAGRGPHGWPRPPPNHALIRTSRVWRFCLTESPGKNRGFGFVQ